jgi:uncharacterized protein YegL
MTVELLEQVEFEQNPEPRRPVVLLLDTSGSMAGKAIDELNAGLQEFERVLKTDSLAALRVEIAVITFGGKVEAVDVTGGGKNPIPFDAAPAFVTADRFQAPTLDANGETPMGEAVRQALTLVGERKAIYKQNSLDYFRPWVFLITDGRPTDAGWEAVADQAKQEETRKGLSFYAVAVEGADLKTLTRFSEQRPPVKLKGLAFRELFNWLSKSLSSVANSQPGQQAPLPPVGWAAVDTSH